MLTLLKIVGLLCTVLLFVCVACSGIEWLVDKVFSWFYQD